MKKENKGKIKRIIIVLSILGAIVVSFIDGVGSYRRSNGLIMTISSEIPLFILTYYIFYYGLIGLVYIVIIPVYEITSYITKKSIKTIKAIKYKNKFNKIYDENTETFKFIGSLDKENLGIKYLSMDNESKYNYYTNQEVKDFSEAVNKRIETLDYLTEKLSRGLREYSYISKEGVFKSFNNYELKGLKELIKFSNVISKDYKEVFNAYKVDMIGISIGKRGEDAVNKNLKMYDHILTNLRNMRFEVDGTSIETDNLVLSEYGIFSLEVKNLGSTGKYGIRIDKDGKWNRIQDGKSFDMSNITDQTYRHVALTEKLFNRELDNLGINRKVKVHPLIVFANDKIVLQNNSDMPVVRISNIYIEISKQDDNLSEDVLNAVKKISLKNTLPAKMYDTVNISEKTTFINNACDEITLILDDYIKLIKDMTDIKFEEEKSL